MEDQESSSCSRDSEKVLGAAQQLMQLSNNDDISSNVVTAENKNKKKYHGGGCGGGEEEEVDQKKCQIETSIWLKIEEIFGKEEEDEEEVCDFMFRPKKRRFRSIESIYMKTKPVVNGRFSGKGIVGT